MKCRCLHLDYFLVTLVTIRGFGGRATAPRVSMGAPRVFMGEGLRLAAPRHVSPWQLPRVFIGEAFILVVLRHMSVSKGRFQAH